jgi:hypothetical protein
MNKLHPIHPIDMKLFVGPDTDPYEQGEYIFRVLEDGEIPLCPSHERIVRCRDCAYSNVPIPLNGCRYCMLDSGCREIDPDGYCSLAEPKEES